MCIEPLATPSTSKAQNKPHWPGKCAVDELHLETEMQAKPAAAHRPGGKSHICQKHGQRRNEESQMGRCTSQLSVQCPGEGPGSHLPVGAFLAAGRLAGCLSVLLTLKLAPLKVRNPYKGDFRSRCQGSPHCPVPSPCSASVTKRNYAADPGTSPADHMLSRT